MQTYEITLKVIHLFIVKVLRLFSMYSETVPLPVPATDSPECIEKLAASGIYIHLKKKAMVEKTR